eukprot:COSAG02_NODE_19909_length_858_cov_2.400527_1_plen_33_part_01
MIVCIVYKRSFKLKPESRILRDQQIILQCTGLA